MHINHSRRLDIALQNGEIDTLRAILVLAHTHLRNAPAKQLHGCPLVRQAGLCGFELHNVKEMLQRLGHGLDIELPAEADPDLHPELGAFYPLALWPTPSLNPESNHGN